MIPGDFIFYTHMFKKSDSMTWLGDVSLYIPYSYLNVCTTQHIIYIQNMHTHIQYTHVFVHKYIALLHRSLTPVHCLAPDTTESCLQTHSHPNTLKT